MLRHQTRSIESILAHLNDRTDTATIGGEPRDLLLERMELEKRKLAMEEEKHRMLLKRALEQPVSSKAEPWSRSAGGA